MGREKPNTYTAEFWASAVKLERIQPIRSPRPLKGAAVKHAWIRKHSTDFPVNRLCRLMDTSRSACYGWLHRSPPPT